jgi:hypothetical protein
MIFLEKQRSAGVVSGEAVVGDVAGRAVVMGGAPELMDPHHGPRGNLPRRPDTRRERQKTWRPR